MYIVLGVACVVMLLGIIYQLSRGKSVAGITPRPAPTPVLPPSHEQLFMRHVSPVFDDMIDKERTAEQTKALYAAYKGVKLEIKS